jgi:hypothetical protein
MMSASVLDPLTSEGFALSVGFVSTPSSLRQILRRSKEVGQINSALKQEAIADDTLREFVSRLMQDFRRGERFRHQLALAALTVAVERRTTGFAEEFLHDLARLQIAEMSLAIRVARECLEHRVSVPATTTKTRTLGLGNGGHAVSATTFASSLSSSEQTHTACVCGGR